MNFQVGDMVYSSRFPSFGYGIVLEKEEATLLIHWTQVKDTAWYNEWHMQLRTLGEAK